MAKVVQLLASLWVDPDKVLALSAGPDGVTVVMDGACKTIVFPVAEGVDPNKLIADAAAAINFWRPT